MARKITQKIFENIAEFYNKKHTTIMYAYEKIKNEISADKELINVAREIKQALRVM